MTGVQTCALPISPTTGTFTSAIVNTTLTAQTVNAATIGNTGATLTGTLSTAAQTNITSVGTLTGLTSSGVISLTNATNNSGTQYSSGALQVTGGAGFGGNVYIGGNAIVVGNVFSSTGNINVLNISSTNAQFFGNAAGFGALYTGIASGFVYQPQTVLQSSTNFNGYAQLNHQNINSGASASTDWRHHGSPRQTANLDGFTSSWQ